VSFVIWAVFIFGLTYLICASAIFQIPRKFLKAFSRFLNGVLSCAPCTSFWVGLFVGNEGALFSFPGELHLVLGNSLCYFLANHLVGGILAVGLVSFAQFATSITFAESDE